MITNTFCHIPGVSVRLEQMLWEQGILSWQCFMDSPEPPVSDRRLRNIFGHLELSMAEFSGANPSFFARSLASRHHWRLFGAFRHSVAYLDIETTGLGGPADHITTIALYDGRSVKHYIYGENLDDFRHDVEEYDLLVTYNGKCFDIPFIRRSLDIPMKQAHIDLMYVLRALGITGGLKGCEKKMGIDRNELDGVDGYFAVLLWREYRRTGRRSALETLLAYNIEDVVNLETLMVMAYNMNLEATPFAADLRLPLPQRPLIPFAADVEIIDRIKKHLITAHSIR